jgi:hypothetical protein
MKAEEMQTVSLCSDTLSRITERGVLQVMIIPDERIGHGMRIREETFSPARRV